MPFLECGQRPANCADAEGPTRSLASRIWHAHLIPDQPLRDRAERAARGLTGSVGRVESGGTFADPQLQRQLSRALPEAARGDLRSRMEWYGCRGAFFHNDAHYGGVLFGVWCVSGPARELVFPRVAQRMPARPGAIVIFDPYEPHAVLAAGSATYRREDYQAAEPSMFLGFEVALSPAVRAAFGVAAPHEGSVLALSSRVAINPETGQPARERAVG